jgi:hypothetical protein
MTQGFIESSSSSSLPTMFSGYLLLVSLLLRSRCDAFSVSSLSLVSTTTTTTTRLWAGTSENVAERKWLNTGILLSSFTDGLRPNREARDILMTGLVKKMWRDRQFQSEQSVEASAVQSPCCGPDLTAMMNMEVADKALENMAEDFSRWKSELERLKDTVSINKDDPIELRFLYIPTAMYALRKDSNNTPGKQRQRARADGKKRRNEIVGLLQEELGQGVCVLAATLDFDDGSIKQPEGSDNKAKFPKVCFNFSKPFHYLNDTHLAYE